MNLCVFCNLCVLCLHVSVDFLQLMLDWQPKEILTSLFFSVFIDSSLSYLWQTGLSSCDLQKLQSVFPPSNQIVWIMQSKNSPRIQKDQRGQSSHPVLPSSYFFITFHWSLSYLICCVWASVIFFFSFLCMETAVFAYQKLTKPCRNLHITDK